MRHAVVVAALCAVSALGIARAGQAVKASSAGAALDRQTLRQVVDRRMGEILLQAEKAEKAKPVERGEVYGQAIRQAEELLAGVAAVADREDAESLVRAAWLRRLLVGMAELEPKPRGELTRYLLEKEKLARAVAFGVPLSGPLAREDVGKIYELLDELRKGRPKEVERLPHLAAAVAIVHAGGLTVRVNENTVASALPLEVFDYYLRNERRMGFPLREMSVDSLAFVVDWAADVKEMEWALSQWQGDPRVGNLYGRIMYDFNHETLGTEKVVTKEGYTLPNLLKYGGVCADQAYFAATVGKAIGVPTAVTVAKGAGEGHAWVAYLNGRDGVAKWDDDYGRYEYFKHLQGRLLDPRSRKWVVDAFVAIEMGAAGEKGESRVEAAAWVDAARMLAMTSATPDEVVLEGRTVKRKTGVSSGLELVEIGLAKSNSFAPGWLLVKELGEKEGNAGLSLAERGKWFDLAYRMCGESYPDFVYEIVESLVMGVDELPRQNAMWEKVVERTQGRRQDLTARARLGQAKMWEGKSQWNKAGAIYEEVIRRLINDTEDAMDALDGGERVLQKMGRGRQVIGLYELAARVVAQPENIQGMAIRSTNWFRIKQRYLEKLEEIGNTDEAARLRQQLGVTERKIDGGRR